MDGIITPEAVVLELETAGVSARSLAALIDLAVQFFGASVLLGVVAATGIGDSGQRTATAVVLAIVMMGYPAVLETVWRGRTVGKRAVGLRVVTLEGAPIRFRHAALRMMGGLVDRWFPPGGATGMLMVLSTRRHQRLGDLMAGTIVVRDPDRTVLPKGIWFPVPPGFEGYAATIDPTALSDEQYTVLRAFLMRNRELTPDARFALADRLARGAADALHHPWNGEVHPEAFIFCVVARYQRRAFPAYQPVAWNPGAMALR